jgi:predicted transcriptional regulator
MRGDALEPPFSARAFDPATLQIIRDLPGGTEMKREEYVRDWMTPGPVTVNLDMPVSQAYDLMKRHHIRRLPVTEGGWLVGIVTLGDLWTAVASLETDSDIFEMAFQMNRFTVMQIMGLDLRFGH